MSENFYLYTESDPQATIYVSQTRVTWTDVYWSDDGLVYKDFGAAYFDADFTHLFDYQSVTSEQGGATNALWALTNDVDDLQGLIDGSKDFMLLFVLHYNIPNSVILHFLEGDGGTEYGETGGNGITIYDGTDYYITIVRDESVGAFGTLYCYVYSDEERETLYDSMSVTLHSSKKDYRYLFPFMGYDATWGGTEKKLSGFHENLVIYNDLKPIVTQQALTDVRSTTATGHGTIVSTGGSAVTQHGHCWNTTGTPTTADNKTTNGAAGTGEFTSAVTGLTPGTLYYFRAYATNTSGTGYSEERSITAGDEDTERGRGNLRIVGTDLKFQNINDDWVPANPTLLESGDLAETGQNSKIFAWQNTEAGQDVFVHKVLIDITTASAAAAQIDVGQSAADAASDNMIDGGALNAVATLNNIIDGGVNGMGAVLVADDEYITGYEDNSANPAGLVGKYYIFYTKT